MSADLLETQAPRDYAEVYQHYFGYIRSLCVKAGIEFEDVNDVAHDLMVKVISRGLLEKYDPDEKFAGEPVRDRRAAFTAMLTSYVTLSLRHYRTKQGKRRKREPIRVEEPVRECADGFEPGLWIEVYATEQENIADITEDVAQHVDFVAAVKRAAAYLASLPMRNPRDRRRFLPELFRLCVEQVVLNGIVNRADIARHFGCSDTAVYHMFRDLKAELRAGGFAPGLI